MQSKTDVNALGCFVRQVFIIIHICNMGAPTMYSPGVAPLFLCNAQVFRTCTSVWIYKTGIGAWLQCDMTWDKVFVELGIKENFQVHKLFKFVLEAFQNSLLPPYRRNQESTCNRCKVLRIILDYLFYLLCGPFSIKTLS